VAAVPIKPQYGPTLGRLLAPRWRAASRPARAAAIVAAVLVVGLALGAVLTLENAHYSHGGRVPFSFSYRGLYRVPAEGGEYVQVQRRGGDGELLDSFAVAPLRLPPYSGGLSGELPLYATTLAQALARGDPGFTLRGAGKTRVNGVPAYNLLYTTVREGRRLFGRDVLLLPEKAGAREGVLIVMLASPSAKPKITTPSELAGEGVLSRPLKSLSIG